MPLRALLADIGGTNTRLALADGPDLVPGSIRRYSNADFPALEPVLHRYMKEVGLARPDAACLAMAGPVRNGSGTLTNLDWTLNTALLSDATGAATVSIINDLQAQGHALGHVSPEALIDVLPSATQPDPHAAQVVVGIGTGFNAAPVYSGPQGRLVPPSEAGHVTLPLHDADDFRLATFIAERRGFADVEEVLSGRGLANVHDWLLCEAGAGPKRSSSEILSALDGADPLAEAAVGTFVRMMGRVAGDLALSILPFGGVYLIGGMSRAMVPHLARFGFGDAFRAKGRFSALMAQFPVRVVADDDAALIGSAHHIAALVARG